MKKLSKIDLESMEKELPALEKSILGSAKGGYSGEQWNCFFNCMEYVGNQWGVTYTDKDYYESFKKDMPYDPGATTPVKIYDSESHGYITVDKYNSIKNASDIETFLVKSDFNYTIPRLKDMQDMKFDGSQIIFIKNSEGLNHAVVGTGYDADKDTVTFIDPTSGKSGELPLNGTIPKIYDICIPGSGSIEMPGLGGSGSLSGYYDGFSGYNSPDGSYYA